MTPFLPTGWQGFVDRVRANAKLTHPRHMFTSTAQVEAAQKLLAEQRPAAGLWGLSGGGGSATAEEIAAARALVDGAVNQSSGEIIPWFGRMGAWPYFGAIPVVAIVLQAKFGSASVPVQSALHWWNQSFVATINYFNGTSAAARAEEKVSLLQHMPASVRDLVPKAGRSLLDGVRATPSDLRMGGAYLGACSSAVSIIICTSLLMRRVPSLRGYARYAAWPAGSAANMANTYCIRGHELETGVEVTTASGDVVGVSRAAAAQSLRETSITRGAIPGATFLVAPALTRSLEIAMPIFARSTPLSVAANVIGTVAAFAVGLPITLGLFDETGSIGIRSLEPALQDRARLLAGPEETQVYYYRGR